MYLHKDKELLEDVISATNERYGIDAAIIEKDYYVTMILKLLAKKSDIVVFKGGTSLSKCYQVINRFSEDIDITFSEHIGEARRKKLKYSIMQPISEELEMPISNWERIESDKALNQYKFQYEPISGSYNAAMLPEVKVETVLGSYAFPVEEIEVTSYIYQYLKEADETELIEEHDLKPFGMHVQSLERTYIDKVFALCDYFIQGKSKRYSRHLYDLFKMQSRIKFDAEFCKLVAEVREHRVKMGEKVCPSAMSNVNISDMLHDICRTEFYKDDYAAITEYFMRDMISYEDAIKNLKEIAESNCF